MKHSFDSKTSRLCLGEQARRTLGGGSTTLVRFALAALGGRPTGTVRDGGPEPAIAGPPAP